MRFRYSPFKWEEDYHLMADKTKMHACEGMVAMNEVRAQRKTATMK